MNDHSPNGRPRRILTVCKGGHCRAPLAAAVLARHGGATVETRAAAIRNWHIGEPAHSAMVAAAARCGYDLTGHRGIQVSPGPLDWADTVLTMDRSVHAALTAQITDPATAGKVRLYLDGQDVPDPWEQPEEAFIACVTVVEAGADRHLQPAIA
ncbi:low molecular weight phosphotyrosine protein phosphatase [Kitasatospora sp. NPDC085879]|uniref:arsenate reductase/protein-tyrosine-phosphatase family protein n=1 Tax=Kitasatospora sp. NPDC085879 TaxID=3154769 RepID=UPI000BDCDB18|nr:low molecular weight phosphotyrosine protein phosphatase [Streptomyces sp. TLI_235]PBC69932.1 protein tyrosine phosphatase [Streptomyces sp. TLI_235]